MFKRKLRLFFVAMFCMMVASMHADLPYPNYRSNSDYSYKSGYSSRSSSNYSVYSNPITTLTVLAIAIYYYEKAKAATEELEKLQQQQKDASVSENVVTDVQEEGAV